MRKTTLMYRLNLILMLQCAVCTSQHTYIFEPRGPPLVIAVIKNIHYVEEI